MEGKEDEISDEMEEMGDMEKAMWSMGVDVSSVSWIFVSHVNS